MQNYLQYEAAIKNAKFYKFWQGKGHFICKGSEFSKTCI